MFHNLTKCVSILFTLVIISVNCYVLHSAGGCFSKHFNARNFNTSDYDDVPIRSDGAFCGEDDFFITELNQFNLLAVADGVGSWNSYGINPKFFVSEFMNVLNEKYRGLSHLTTKMHDTTDNTIFYELVYKSLIILIRKTQIAQMHFGSCTLAALSLNLKTLHLNSYLVGDAGFMIIRNSTIYYRSIDQLKGFNFPYQLGLVDTSDHPFDGITKTFQLKANDIIIIGSDGLFDNIFDDRILDIVNEEAFYMKIGNRKSLTDMARSIVKKLTVEAKKLGETLQGIWTPFSLNVAINFGMLWQAGKNDDTTVIVAIVDTD